MIAAAKLIRSRAQLVGKAGKSGVDKKLRYVASADVRRRFPSKGVVGDCAIAFETAGRRGSVAEGIVQKCWLRTLSDRLRVLPDDGDIAIRIGEVAYGVDANGCGLSRSGHQEKKRLGESELQYWSFSAFRICGEW